MHTRSSFGRSLPGKPPWPRNLLPAAILLALQCAAAHAATRVWTDSAGDALWSTAGNWNPTGVPGSGDTVNIVGGPSFPINSGWSVTYNYAGPAVTLGSLLVSRGNVLNFHAANVLTMNAGNLTATNEILGDGGKGNGVFNSNGGNNTVNGTLTLGNLSTDSGAYNFNPSILANLVATNEIVGEAGTGSITQNDGNSLNTLTSTLTLGDQAGSSGSYNLQFGELRTINGIMIVGGHGTGTFTQTVNTVVGPLNAGNTNTLIIGQFANSTGTYNYVGGGDFGNLFADTLFLNMGGANATFNQAGGIIDITSSVSTPTVYIGYGAGGSANYNFSDGSIHIANSGLMIIGNLIGSTGTLTQTGGFLVFNPTGNTDPRLILGNAGGAAGFYSLSNGNISIVGQEIIGNSGSGAFVQNGGNNSLFGPRAELILAQNITANGSYSLSGGVINTLELLVAINGRATFTQSGGSVTTTIFDVASGFSSIGSFSLSASGALSTATEEIGINGNASFTQSGGSNVDSANIFLGEFAGAVGSYSLSAGTLSVGFNEYIALNGAATFIQTGGTHTLTNSTGSFSIGNVAGSVGSYSLSGAASLSVAGFEYVGYNGNGSFSQTGGSHSVANFLAIAANPGSTGAYSLLDGALSASDIYVGGSNTGIGGNGTLLFNSPASLNVSGNLTVFASGSLSGNGSSTANLILNGGTVSPGTSITPGTLTLGSITINTGRLNFRPGDLLASSGNVNLPAPATAFLNGLFPSSTPLILYAGTLTGSPSNLSIFGGSVGLSYRAINDPANHSLSLAATPIARNSQISITNQPSPDGHTFTPGLSPGAVNNAGKIVFFADMTSSGPVRFDGSAYTALLLTGQPAPGPGAGTFNSSINYIDNINASAQTAIISSLANTTDGSTEGLFRADASATVPIVRFQQSLPNSGGTVTGFPFSSAFNHINDAGQIPFTAFLSNAADGATSAIYRGDGNLLTPIARDKQSAPGPGGGIFNASFGPFNNGFTDPLINNAGQVAFFANLASSTNGTTLGLFRGDGNTTIQIVRNTQPAPGAGGGTLFSFGSSYALNNAGQIAFLAALSGTSDSSTIGLFRGDGNSLIPIAREKAPAPGQGNGNFSTNIQNLSINAAGQVAFYASTSNSSLSSNGGIFRGDGNSLIAIARDKQLAPSGAGATFSLTFAMPTSIAAGGQVAFTAPLANSPDGNASAVGAFIGDGTDLLPIARSSQFITTSQGLRQLGNTINIGPVNDFGQVAWATFFANTGDSANFLFTPILHWRSNTSGNWDTSTNWTLSLAPASVHDVIIDPASPLTITGPAANTAIQSLTISTPATLKLSTGTLKLSSPLVLAGSTNNWTGLLDLAAAKLIIQITPATRFTTLANLRNQLLFAQSHPAGITSSTLPAHTAIALLDNSITHFATFGTLPVDNNSLLLAPELLGDANIDGTVNLSDLNTVLSHFGTQTPNWTDGNFDNAPTIDLTDLADVLNNFNQSLPTPTATQSPIPTPEPASLLLLSLLLPCLPRRRPI